MVNRTPQLAHAQDISSNLQSRVVILMTLGHLTNDLYANFLAPILPVLIQQFGLSMFLAGLLTTVQRISGQTTQPIYGFLGDRGGRRWLLGLGPLLTVTIMGLTGLAPNYVVLIVLVFIAGVGSAAFHPQAAVLAGKASGERHGLGMGVFISGGAMGVALAPWIVVPVVLRWGLRGTLLAALPGLLITLFLSFSERRLHITAISGTQRWRLDFAGQGRTLGLLLAIAVSRTITHTSLLSFLPVLTRERGFTLMEGGAVFSLFVLSAGLASMMGGYLGDLTDPRRVIGFTMLLAIPFLQLALRSQDSSLVILMVLSGMLLMASESLTTALAQRVAPHNAGTASSVIMGLGLGLGGVGASLVGRLADGVGLVSALMWISWLPLLPAGLTLFLPRFPRQLR